MQSLLPSSTLSYLQSWFKTAKAVMNQHDTSIKSWPDKIRVMPRGVQLQAPVIDHEVQAVIYQSLSEEKRVQITYQPRASKEMKEYSISPLTLVVRDQVIYLLCTMKDYSDIRQLALHRIKSVEMTEQAINRPSDFDVDAYIASGAFGFLENSQTIKLVAIFKDNASAHLHDSPVSADQRLEWVEAKSEKLFATVPDSLEIVWWLLGFGDQVEVILPLKLRKKMADLARKMHENYTDRG